MTDDAVTAHIPYGSILLFHKSFLTEYGSCDNTQAADAEQDDPEIHHAVVAGLRAVRIGRKTYVVLTYVALAVAVSICVCCRVGLVATSAFVPMVILIGLPIGAMCVSMSKSGSDLKATDRALDRIGLSCGITVGSMSCLAAVDHNATACDSTDVPVTGCILLPFGAFGMTESCSGGEGIGTLLAALTGLVVLGRLGAVCLACKVLICNYFLIEYVGVLELCFDLITAHRTLNCVLFGSTTLVIGSMCCLAAVEHNATACTRTDVPGTGCIRLPVGACGMAASCAGGEGFGTLLAALARLVVLGRIGAVCLACKILVCNYFLIEYVGVTELSFDLKLTDGALDRILFGSTTLVIGSMCIEVFRLGTACRVALMPVTVCATFPSGGVPIVVSNSTVGYVANIANGGLLAGCNVSTGRSVFSLGAVNYDTATNNSTFFPVVLSVGRPNIGRSMCTCRNGLTVTDDLTAAKALGIAGITVGLRLVVCFGLVDKSSAANVVVCILFAEEYVAVVVLYLTASGAGIVVNSIVIAVALGFQRFRFLIIRSIAVSSKSTVRLTTHGTNSLCSTGCCSSGVIA